MLTKILKDILDRAEAWPEADQRALAEFAREIEASRSGLYRLSDEERFAIEEAKQTELLPDEEVASYWKRHGIT
jgi:hypothetical protein